MKPGRALIAALGVLGLTALTLFAARNPAGFLAFWPGCLFRKCTGIYCPGCGMTRATFALFEGDVALAFRQNPVGIILLPLALIGLLIEAIRWTRGRATGPLGGNRPWVSRSLVILVVGFWIFRNLPWWPFSLLAPID